MTTAGIFDFAPTLSGARLTLRPLAPGDWAALYGVASDRLIWEVHPASNRWQEPVFRIFFDTALAEGGGLVALDRSTGAVIGSSRFSAKGMGDDEVEIGWTFLARSHWGGMYNGEMKRLMLDHAFRFVDRAIFTIGVDNVRSRRAIEKIGGVPTGRRHERAMAGKLVDHVDYAIARGAFRAPR